MLALTLVALSLGLSNFAAAIGIGTAGVSASTRLKVGVVFGVFETGMPIVGLLLGRGLARDLGAAAHWTSAGLLIATGAWSLVRAARAGPSPAAAERRQGNGRLVITGLAASVDNLAVGFALGPLHVGLVPAVITIGGVSVGLSLVGLELGARIGAKAGQRGELLGGLVLVGAGTAIAAGVI